MFNRKSKLRGRSAPNPPARSMYSYYSVPTGAKAEAGRNKDYAKRLNPKYSWWRHIPTILAAGLIIISIGYALSLNTNPKIIQLATGSDLFLQAPSVYRAAAQKQFKGSILNTNKITVNISGITRQLRQQFPELSDVSITVPMLGHRPIIYLAPSKPTMILNSNGNSYVLNDRAIAVIRTNSIPNLTNLKLPTLTDETNLPIKLGDTTLPVSNLNFITTVVDQLQTQKIKIKSLILAPRANELDIQIEGQSYFIKMDIQGEANEQSGAFVAVNNQLTKLQQLPKDYIDVRVPGRAYYK